MKPYGYYPVPFTTLLWAHNTRRINIFLCVDYFEVKFLTIDDANHLLYPLKRTMRFQQIGRDSITLDWNYSKEYVYISMPKYVTKALDRLQHPNPKILQYAPHLWTVPAYRKIFHMAPNPDNSNLLDKKSTKIIQSIVGTMIYYAWSVDPTMIRAINEISRVQSNPTMDTKKKTSMLIEYAVT